MGYAAFDVASLFLRFPRDLPTTFATVCPIISKVSFQSFTRQRLRWTPSTGSFGETPSFDEENGIDLDSMLLRHCWTALRHDCIAIEVLGTECDLVHQDQSLSVVIH